MQRGVHVQKRPSKSDHKADFVKATLTWNLTLRPSLRDDLSSRPAACRFNSDMQIVSGACLFVIAVILLAYVPGKLLLIALRRRLSPLEDVTLACFLGLIASGLAYWLFMYTHQVRFFLVWPLMTSAAFVWLYARRTKTLAGVIPRSNRPCPQRAPQWCVTHLVPPWPELLRSELSDWHSAFYYANLTPRADGTMRACPVPDVILHIAIYELTYTIPPQAPPLFRAPAFLPLWNGCCGRDVCQCDSSKNTLATVRCTPSYLVSALSMLMFFRFFLVGFDQDILVLSSCSWCFLAKTSPSFPECYWAKTLTGPFAISVCPLDLVFIRIQSFLDWDSFLRGCLVSSVTCRGAAERGFSLLRCCLSR